MATNRKFHHGISKGISKNDLSPVQFPLLYLRLGSSLSRDAQASLSLDTFFISTRGISRHSRASRETSYLRGLGLFLRPIPVGLTLNLGVPKLPQLVQIGGAAVLLRAPDSISKGVPCQETHFNHYYPRSWPLTAWTYSMCEWLLVSRRWHDYRP